MNPALPLCLLLILVLFPSLASSLNLFASEDWTTGYLDASPRRGGTFYYLFRSRQPKPTPIPPLMIWLGGGPGCSAANAVFLELGPQTFSHHELGSLGYNRFSWNNASDLLLLDFPAGTGLSLDLSDSTMRGRSIGYQSEQLSVLMQKFVESNPEYKGRRTYFACEGYTCQILVKFLASHKPADVSGIVLRNAMLDYSSQSNWNRFAYSKGLLSWIASAAYELQLAVCRFAISLDFHTSAACDRILDSVAQSSGVVCMENLNAKECYERELSVLTDLMTDRKVQDSFGISGFRPFSVCNSTVRSHLDSELKKSAAKKELQQVLASGVKVRMVYSEFGFVQNWMGGLAVAEGLEWAGQSQFKAKEMNTDACAQWKKEQTLEFRVIKGSGQRMGWEAAE